MRSVKRHMGTDWKINADDKDYSAQEISARILQKLKRDAESYRADQKRRKKAKKLRPAPPSGHAREMAVLSTGQGRMPFR